MSSFAYCLLLTTTTTKKIQHGKWKKEFTLLTTFNMKLGLFWQTGAFCILNYCWQYVSECAMKIFSKTKICLKSTGIIALYISEERSGNLGTGKQKPKPCEFEIFYFSSLKGHCMLRDPPHPFSPSHWTSIFRNVTCPVTEICEAIFTKSRRWSCDD